MHSSVELVALSDVEATTTLLAAFARRLGPDFVLER
jgi:putative aminopeptidase FrvX